MTHDELIRSPALGLLEMGSAKREEELASMSLRALIELETVVIFHEGKEATRRYWERTFREEAARRSFWKRVFQ